LKSVHTLVLFATLLAGSAAAKAQALPTASRPPVQVGVAWSFASSGYGNQEYAAYIKGVTAFGDFGFTRRLSLEGDAHYTSLSTPDGIGENTYLIGPRYSIALEDRANVYVKVLGGVGRFSYKSPTYVIPHTDTYGVLAFGGGIEFRLSPRINLRPIDIEIQPWQGFPHGLVPIVTSIGIAYVH
jgi:hypothetical protein